jgi:hypothetical protein
MFINYDKELVVLEKNGIRLFEIESGERVVSVKGDSKQGKPKFKNYTFNASKVSYAFSHEDVINYVNNKKVFAVK